MLLRARLKMNSQSQEELVNREDTQPSAENVRCPNISHSNTLNPELWFLRASSAFCLGYYKEMTANFFLTPHSLLKSPPMWVRACDWSVSHLKINFTLSRVALEIVITYKWYLLWSYWCQVPDTESGFRANKMTQLPPPCQQALRLISLEPTWLKDKSQRLQLSSDYFPSTHYT